MIFKSIAMIIGFVFAFGAPAFAAQPEDTGIQKAKTKVADAKAKKAEKGKDQKAEADAALKKVEAMTEEARGTEKKDKEKKK